MSEPEEDWNAKIDKWGRGIEATEATESDVLDYIRTKVYQYTLDQTHDFNLWDLFQDDFKTFTLTVLGLINRRELQKLRACLRRGGVFVAQNTKNLTIPQTFVNAITEDEQHEWTESDVQEVISDLEGGVVTSRFIRRHPHWYPGITLVHPPTPSVTPAPLSMAPPSRPRSITPPPPRSPPPQDDPLSEQEVTTDPPPRTEARSGPSKQVSEIMKVYADDDKYDGRNGSLDYKLIIFRDICRRVELPQEALMQAFPAMLKGLPRSQFYSKQLSNRTFDEACTYLRNYFEGPSFQRRNYSIWNSTTLATITTANLTKSTYENVQLLIDKLQELQYGLHPKLRDDFFLYDKLVAACEGSPACKDAITDPPDGLGNLINKLQSSIHMYEKQQELGPEVFFTDRWYHGRNSNSGGSVQSSSRPGSNSQNRSRIPSNRQQHSVCFICKRADCRSWKHTTQEQEETRTKFKYNTLSRFAPNTRPPDTRFNRSYQQYVTDFEDNESNFINDVGSDLFESLLSDDNNQGDTAAEQTANTPSTSTTFFTSCGPLSDPFATSITADLANRTCAHQLTTATPVSTAPNDEIDNIVDIFAALSPSRYNSTEFFGIVIDTGASEHSTAGFEQFQALQRLDESVTLDKSAHGTVKIQFGIGSTSSIGSTKVNTPIGQIEFHVLPSKTPFLLCLKDMDALNVEVSNLTNTLVTPNGRIPLVRRFGHCFLLWNAPLQTAITESFNYYPCLLTDAELQRLHRRFGHPSVARLQRILDRAGHEVDHQALRHLTKYCEHCQRHGKSPGRFKFNLRDDVNFNYSIIVDVFYIEGKPVLHIVDEGTRYQAGRWLQNLTAKHTWDTLRMCWIDTYLGPPDQITTDAGKNFASEEFDQYAQTVDTRVNIVPVEAHNSVGIVERYHALVRRAYSIISAEIPDIDKDMALQMAFEAVNDSAGPDGLVPTLLVYGAFPRMTNHDLPSHSITQRAKTMRKATAEIQKIRARRQVADALHTRNGPSTTSIHDLVLNSDVLVWREGNAGQIGSWKGLYKLLSVDGETCVLALPHGNTKFQTTVVKPYFRATDVKDTEDTVPVQEVGDTIIVDTRPLVPTQALNRRRGRPRKYPMDANLADITVFLQEEHPYTGSRQAEITGLIEKGVFEPVPLSVVPKGTRIFNARFVDEVKNGGTDKAFEKSRLVVQAYNDQNKQLVLTQSPTIQRISQRLLLCIAAIRGTTAALYLRDISQAYVQSTTSLNRDFYIRPPSELLQRMGLEPDIILRVVKPLYGVPEAGNHWFKTYHTHHTKELSMEQSTYDPCLLYSNEPFGVVGLQTDDTLFLADNEFAEQEQIQLQKAGFLAKERERLTPNKDLKFNGGIIRMDSTDGITLTQERQCKNLKPVSDKETDTTSSRGIVRQNLSTKEQYVAQRARGAYVASVCQPEAAYDLSIAAQATQPTEKDIKALNTRLQWQIENEARGMHFVKLDQDSLQLLAFTDASFANNKDLSSQIGYVLVLADAKGRANILHWSSIKCQRVTRSVLASELYGMTHGFDMGASVKSTIEKILRIKLPLILCTDSQSLYDCLVKLGTTQEKRLMIDVMCLRESYERREITEVKWIKGKTNPADSMTKAKPSSALKQLIDTNRVHLDVMEWVERSGEVGKSD